MYFLSCEEIKTFIIIIIIINEVMDITKTVKTLNLAKKRILPYLAKKMLLPKKWQHLNPWSRILDEAQERHEIQLNALVDEYQRNGDSENVAHLKAQNALYWKELRKVLLEYLQWMRAIKKDYTFQKVMETQKDLKDTDGFDWLESTELAIDKRKFLLNRMFVEQPIPQDED